MPLFRPGTVLHTYFLSCIVHALSRPQVTNAVCVCCSGECADSDAVKSVSVMEGDSVTLQTNTELQTKDRIMWTFGHSETLIALIDKDDSRFSTYDVLDGKFRDRLKLDHQTVSLIITNTRTRDSGLYQVSIRSTRLTTYRFNVTVSGESQLQTVSFVLLVFIIIIHN